MVAISCRAADQTSPNDMRWIPGGTFMMGSDAFYPEEGPVHPVTVDGFWMDEHPVTVADFRRFVKATGHVTVAEQAPNPADYPGADPTLLVPGSLVFRQPPGPVDLDDMTQWWAWLPGASWRHPDGTGSTISGRERHPVTHVAHADAAAYAAWAGKALPSEAEWERAARGGLEGAAYSWGDDPHPGGRAMANTWQGRFPWEDLKHARGPRTSAVKRYPANGYGLYDMTGNVWEWTSDFFTSQHLRQAPSPCCVPHNPRVDDPDRSYDRETGERLPRRVIKGGSHLCAPNYCLRYRPAARQGQAIDSSTSHLGFRCISRPS